MTLTCGLFTFDLEAMLARAQSLCFDRPEFVETPASASATAPSPSPSPEQNDEPGLMTMIIDSLRGHHAAFVAVRQAIRQWRNAHPGWVLPPGCPAWPPGI